MSELSILPENPPRRKKPDWLRVKLPTGENYRHVRGLVDHYKLHTICESGNCPNMGECWGAGHGHVHDSRQYMHAFLRILRCGNRHANRA
jgi:lipoate synthase